MKSKTIVLYLLSMIFVLIGLIFISLTLKNEKEMLEDEDVVLTTATTTTISSNNFRIEDRTKYCAQAIETLYEDDNYTYTLNCIKSGTIFLVYDDGSEISVRNALDTNKVTIKELQEAGLAMNVSPKK